SYQGGAARAGTFGLAGKMARVCRAAPASALEDNRSASGSAIPAAPEQPEPEERDPGAVPPVGVRGVAVPSRADVAAAGDDRALVFRVVDAGGPALAGDTGAGARIRAADA